MHWFRRETVWPLMVAALMWWLWDRLTAKELAAAGVFLLVFWMAQDREHVE